MFDLASTGIRDGRGKQKQMVAERTTTGYKLQECSGLSDER
jgi:hypothetical protein